MFFFLYIGRFLTPMLTGKYTLISVSLCVRLYFEKNKGSYSLSLARSLTHSHSRALVTHSNSRWRSTAASAGCSQQKGQDKTSPGLRGILSPLGSTTWAACAASLGYFNGAQCSRPSSAFPSGLDSLSLNVEGEEAPAVSLAPANRLFWSGVGV